MKPTYLPRSRRARGFYRALRYAVFIGTLVALLFGSYRNQFAELFPSLIGAPPVVKAPTVVKLGPNGASPPAGSKLPTVVKLGSDSRTQLDSLTTGAIGGSKLPTVVKPGESLSPAPGASKLPTVVKPTAALQPNRIEVVDGDTVRLDGQSYRLVGLDTPESGARAKCAAEREKATAAVRRLREIVAGGGIRLDRVACNCPANTEGTEQCNYGRLCGVLTSSGRDVGQTLIGEGLARSYNCGAWYCPPKQPWC
jgi:endonuclease YncB( thermonuclease family)